VEFPARRCAKFLFLIVLVLLSAGEAHAQRIPEFVVWSAGASLFAPFVAVPVKAAILRLLPLEATFSRLWSICAIEWVLWFPVAFILLRSGRLSSAPLVLLALLATAVWLHGARVENARLGYALILSLITPILALVLPFLAVMVVAHFESLAA
jgi:hypothetical protein